MAKDALGIPNYGIQYLKLLPSQDGYDELYEIGIFIEHAINNIFGRNNIDDFQFINYGSTQLVFVLTLANGKQFTLVVNQPATKQGVGKKEFDNLIALNALDSETVIQPTSYFSENGRELYVTPYYYQARCIGVQDGKWGIWIPEPEYMFKPSAPFEREIINIAMVALLIKLYDKENNRGLSECRLDGGDFMLVKGFENDAMNTENIMKNIKLIAARKLVSISLDDYIERIRIELSNEMDDDSLVVIGKKLKCPLTKEEIEEGIKLGLSLIRQDHK